MRWTIQRRLTVWYTGFLLLVLLILGLVLYQSLSRSLRAEVVRSVTAQAQKLVDSLGASEEGETDEGGAHFDIADPDLISDFGSPGMYIEVEEADGTLLNRSLELRGYSLSGGDLEATIASSSVGSNEIRDIPQIGLVLVHSRSVASGATTIAILRVGRSIEFIDTALAQLRFVLLILTVAGVFLTVIVGSILARRALAPIDRITQTARKIGVEDLNQRLHLKGPDDEVTRLGASFDDMLDRVEDGFLRERQFSSDVAHELRTPLTILKGTTEVALRSGENPPSCRDVLKSIEEETDRMIRLVEALLLLSRSESGQFPLAIRRVALVDVCQAVIASFSSVAHEQGIELSANLVEDVHIAADMERIQQLLRNLITNALKYTLRGGSITLSLHKDGSDAVISIADTGIGIPSEDLPHVFERFYRVDQSRSRGAGGMGLGLSIVLAIAEAHEGQMTVVSHEGKGTTFSLRLPLSQ